MFHFDPISTTNIIAIAQVIAVILGFYFSWRSIRLATQSLNTTRDNIALATQNAQVQLYNNMLIQGRELQIKFMDDLASQEEKLKLFMGIIIAYYASCFELRGILSLPDNAKKLLDNDVKESMRQEAFKKRFAELRNLHSKDFGKYVDELRGV